MSARRRVVITGLGAVTPLGHNVQETWQNITQGKSGAGPITRFDASHLPCKIASEVKNFNVENHIPAAQAKRMDRFCHFAIIASLEAFSDSGLSFSEQEQFRAGVIIGVGMGGLQAIEDGIIILKEKGIRRVSPFIVPMMIPNLASGHVSIKLGLKGPNECTTTACAAGSHAIGNALNHIREGRADIMLAGGAEAVITNLGVAAFCACRALSNRNDEPAKASRPFDKDRDGFVMGEGAGILVLEEYNHAIKRGAKIYAELVGYGLNSDASHITNPSSGGEGAARCMTMALADAEIIPYRVGYINAHGTSTDMGDIAETQAIKKVFGKYAYELPVSSTKSMTGHLLGAAGGVEAIFSILALKGVLPPTINLEHPDEECDLNYIPNHPIEKKIDYALSNSFGFGGTNASLIFKRV